LFLPSWLVLTCIFAGVFTMDIVESERAKSQAALVRMRNLKHLVRVELKALVSNGLLLRAQPDLQRLLFNRDPQALDSLAKSFLAFCQSKPGFLEVAFLDNQGRELLKVQSRNGLRAIAPAQALDMRDLDSHYAAIDGLAANELMVFSRWRKPAPDSGLDEECVIELVIPVTDGQGRRRGALTASYAGEDFFLGLEDEPSAATDGFAVVGPQGRCLFSSYPGPRAGQPLAELWPRMERAKTASFRVGGAQYVFAAMKPMLEGLRHSTGEAEALLTSATAKRLMDEEQWWLVVRQPPESWPASWRGPLRNHLPWYLALSLAVGVLGRNWTARLANREEAFRQARLAQERSRIGSAFEHAAIGTAIVSMDYRLLAVNRYLCQTLGRDREELVGQGLGPHLPADDYRVLLGGMAKALEEDTPRAARSAGPWRASRSRGTRAAPRCTSSSTSWI
jgi:PAS domain-containing protein